MAELPLDQGIPRFKGNEDRFNTLVNGGPADDWQTTGGVTVPSVRKMLAARSEEITQFLIDKDIEINTGAESILSGANSAKEAAETAAQATGQDRTAVTNMLNSTEFVTVYNNIAVIANVGNDMANVNAVAGKLDDIEAAVAALPELSEKLSKDASNVGDDTAKGVFRGNVGLGSIATHNVTFSTDPPPAQGLEDGHIWMQYE